MEAELLRDGHAAIAQTKQLAEQDIAQKITCEDQGAEFLKYNQMKFLNRFCSVISEIFDKGTLLGPFVRKFIFLS